jgi:pyruvate dehydrogenase E1 component alpha subunit
VPPELFEEWARKDPVELFAAKLQELGFATEDEIAAMRDEARRKGIEARKKALADPMPQPDNEEERVYAP